MEKISKQIFYYILGFNLSREEFKEGLMFPSIIARIRPYRFVDYLDIAHYCVMRFYFLHKTIKYSTNKDKLERLYKPQIILLELGYDNLNILISTLQIKQQQTDIINGKDSSNYKNNFLPHLYLLIINFLLIDTYDQILQQNLAKKKKINTYKRYILFKVLEAKNNYYFFKKTVDIETNNSGVEIKFIPYFNINYEELTGRIPRLLRLDQIMCEVSSYYKYYIIEDNMTNLQIINTRQQKIEEIKLNIKDLKSKINSKIDPYLEEEYNVKIKELKLIILKLLRERQEEVEIAKQRIKEIDSLIEKMTKEKTLIDNNQIKNADMSIKIRLSKESIRRRHLISEQIYKKRKNNFIIDNNTYEKFLYDIETLINVFCHKIYSDDFVILSERNMELLYNMFYKQIYEYVNNDSREEYENIEYGIKKKAVDVAERHANEMEQKLLHEISIEKEKKIKKKQDKQAKELKRQIENFRRKIASKKIQRAIRTRQRIIKEKKEQRIRIHNKTIQNRLKKRWKHFEILERQRLEREKQIMRKRYEKQEKEKIENFLKSLLVNDTYPEEIKKLENFYSGRDTEDDKQKIFENFKGIALHIIYRLSKILNVFNLKLMIIGGYAIKITEPQLSEQYNTSDIDIKICPKENYMKHDNSISQIREFIKSYLYLKEGYTQNGLLYIQSKGYGNDNKNPLKLKLVKNGRPNQELIDFSFSKLLINDYNDSKDIDIEMDKLLCNNNKKYLVMFNLGLKLIRRNFEVFNPKYQLKYLKKLINQPGYEWKKDSKDGSWNIQLKILEKAFSQGKYKFYSIL